MFIKATCSMIICNYQCDNCVEVCILKMLSRHLPQQTTNTRAEIIRSCIYSVDLSDRIASATRTERNKSDNFVSRRYRD